MDEATRQRLAEEKAQRQQVMRDRLAEAFPGQDGITLEIGCGHGRWLASFAEVHPERRCVGIDLISRRIRFGEDKHSKRALCNVLFLKAECTEFIGARAPQWQLDDCFVLFPDPWPKKRHHKKRMVQDAFLSQLRQVMKPSGRFYFRTDQTDYFAWTEEKVEKHPDWSLAVDAQWPHAHSSYFQDILPDFQSLLAVPQD